ncbi:DsbA family protein [Sulfurospirillum diekertiae]|uniref:DsbA family protein n=1 Tax=Sulfurospirillum diekertiae TaxID=1854492 RepID=A0A6G9VPQ0_9BACT|nr:thioredoxin domain-containing protein [Sulfurospirillum diekertiae]QIR74862.1 DsbA family protein [Sulfurospirillum diekertiae]QIR77526.1 DsbA family protein [Sulfurospirillum diekertiae]
MRSLMLKLLTTLITLSSLSLFAADANADLDTKVTTFLQKAIVPNENYTFDKVVILKKEAMKEMPDWMVYFVRIDLNLVKQEGKKLSVNDMVFTNGKILSKDFTNLNNGRSVKGSYSLDMDASAYNKEHLLEGNLNAPHKIVVFSDPSCPFCMDFVPEVLADVQKYPETFALFYYHFPLNIHPASPTLVKAMIFAEEKGDHEIVKKVYKEFFDIKETDEKAILDIFNKALNKNFTIEQINQPHILKQLNSDQELANALMVNGTPTIYLDGKKDDTKRSYRKFIKESK